MDKGYISEIELAAYWGISPKTIQRWRTEGRGPDYVKFGKCVRYSLNDAAIYEANHLVKRRLSRAQIAQDSAPPNPYVEVKLTPEQEAVLGRIREFLNSGRRVPTAT